MTELFLEFTNNGHETRIPVYGERSFVGRHTESDVYIPDGRLSRRHLQIERVGDAYIASDAGSSNGTILNGTRLTGAAALKDGDVLDLGGFELRVIFKEEVPAPVETDADQSDIPVPADAAVETPEPAGVIQSSTQTDAGAAPAPAAAASGSGSMLLWIMIPVFGIVFIFFAGVVLFLVLGGSTTTATKQTDPTLDEDIYSDTRNEKNSNDDEDSKNSSSSISNTSGSNTNTNSGSSGTNSSQTGKLSETAKIEQNGAAFLRRIAHNDPRAFLTTEQAGKLSSRIKQFSGSSAVADNLKSAAKNSAQIKTLAESKSLKPQFVAVAAVAKLGSSRGDVLQTAQSMIDVLGKLSTHLGNELADDSLLVIAAYGQGAAGDTMKMRNMLQQLANQSPESSRAIRTIWFLQKNGKITNAEFENALNFLAIGTISQNPKDFGVNTDPLAL